MRGRRVGGAEAPESAVVQVQYHGNVVSGDDNNSDDNRRCNELTAAKA